MEEPIIYPPRFKAGFLSNNPPACNLLPKAMELLLHGVGKTPP